MTLLCLAVLAGPVWAQPATLPQAQSEAREAVEAARPAFEPLRRELRGLADALDRKNESGDEDAESKPLAEVARDGREVVAEQRPRLDPRLAPSLDALDALFRDLPKKDYARYWAAEVPRIVAEQLRWSAERASGVDALNRELTAALALPARLPEENGPDNLALFPTDVPLEKWKKLNPIPVWLMKHRLKRPKRYAKTTADDIVAGRHGVEVGVELEGVVTLVDGPTLDQDYCFYIGNLQFEMTPEWRVLHPGIVKPKVGDRVRLRGWTYYDSFHKAEHEYSPSHPLLGDSRYTLWEMHPVQDVEKLP